MLARHNFVQVIVLPTYFVKLYYEINLSSYHQLINTIK